MIIKVLDVNDNAPVFEKSLYEFVLLPDLSNFTAPAFIKATDRDAENPNNVVRYEIINGNYEGKFKVDKITGNKINIHNNCLIQLITQTSKVNCH